jgi:hypothetical protein
MSSQQNFKFSILYFLHYSAWHYSIIQKLCHWKSVWWKIIGKLWESSLRFAVITELYSASWRSRLEVSEPTFNPVVSITSHFTQVSVFNELRRSLLQQLRVSINCAKVAKVMRIQVLGVEERTN